MTGVPDSWDVDWGKALLFQEGSKALASFTQGSKGSTGGCGAAWSYPGREAGPGRESAERDTGKVEGAPGERCQE